MSWVRFAVTAGAGVALGFLLARAVVVSPGAAVSPSMPQPPAAAAPAQPSARLVPADPAVPATPAVRSLADILRIDSDFEQTAALYELVRHADAAKIEALIEETDSVPGLTDRRAALSILYGRYADLAPQAAVDYLLAHGGPFKQVELRAVFHAWARSDLPAALARAAELDPAWRQVAAHTVLLSRDDLPPARQRQVADELGVAGALRQIEMQQVMDRAATNPAGAWRSAVSNLDAAAGRQVLQAVAGIWARADPVAALNAVTAVEDAQLRPRLQLAVVGQWSRQFPQDAVAWALAQPESEHRSNLIAQALGGMTEAVPRTAVDIAQGLSGRERSDALQRVFSQWAAQDPQAAAAAHGMLTQPGLRSTVAFSIASQYARQDAEAALEWIGTLEPAEAANAGQVVVSRLAREDAQRTSRLLSRLPQGSPREQATQTLAMQWARQDADAALRFVEGITSRSEREAAIVGAISSQRLDPEVAESLYGELRDETRRAQAAHGLYQALSPVDAQRAERYRQAAGLRQ